MKPKIDLSDIITDLVRDVEAPQQEGFKPKPYSSPVYTNNLQDQSNQLYLHFSNKSSVNTVKASAPTRPSLQWGRMSPKKPVASKPVVPVPKQEVKDTRMLYTDKENRRFNKTSVDKMNDVFMSVFKDKRQ